MDIDEVDKLLDSVAEEVEANKMQIDGRKREDSRESSRPTSRHSHSSRRRSRSPRRDRDRERERDRYRRREDDRDHYRPSGSSRRSVSGDDDHYRPSRRDEQRSSRDGGRRDRSRDRDRERRRDDRDRGDRRDRDRDHGREDRRGGHRPRSRDQPKKETPELNDDERDSRTVFVQQLAARLRTKDLSAFFSSCGPVKEAQIVKDRVSGRSKG